MSQSVWSLLQDSIPKKDRVLPTPEPEEPEPESFPDTIDQFVIISEAHGRWLEMSTADRFDVIDRLKPFYGGDFRAASEALTKDAPPMPVTGFRPVPYFEAIKQAKGFRARWRSWESG